MTKAIEDFSHSFYPFLHDENEKPQELMAELRLSPCELSSAVLPTRTTTFTDRRRAWVEFIRLP